MSTPASPEKLGISVSPKELNGDSKGSKSGLVSLVSDGNGDEVLSPQPEACRVYKIRWVVLTLFVFYSMSNAFQWIQFAIINNLIVKFYSVSSLWVDMTSMIYMIVYIPLIFPATYLLERYGLRKCILVGCFGTCLGTWIKVFSASPNLFAVAFIGQTVVAISQIFVLGIPALLAAVWFGPDQVSTATSIGVFGNQLGIAAGFVLPTILVKDGPLEQMAVDLRTMHIGTGIVTAGILVAVIFVFRDRPPTPPSMAQLALLTADKEPYVNSIKRLLSNVGFILLLVSYGLNTGVFYAISTLLSDFIDRYHKDSAEDAGRIGLMIVLSGMVGSVVCGFILDKTRKFKYTTLATYFLSFSGMLAYTFTLPYAVGHIAYLYVVFSALGFFMTGYLPVGFEFAAEITYPESEGTSSGLLNASAQVFGIILTFITREVFEIDKEKDKEIFRKGNHPGSDLGANLVLCGILLVGVIMTALIKEDKRRTTASITQHPAAHQTSFDNPIIANSEP